MPAMILALVALLLLTACGPEGPTEADMSGCAVRSGGPAITYREVADCAVDRAEFSRERESAVPSPYQVQGQR
jgi:hypothetical protein